MVILALIAEVAFIIIGVMLILGGFAGALFSGKINGESIALLLVGALVAYLAINFGPIGLSIG